MDISQDSTNSETAEIAEKVNADRFDIRRYSRWRDTKDRMLVVIGIYLGMDAARPYSGSLQRVGVDLLLVDEEKVEYMDVGRFIFFVINQKLIPWKDPPKEEKPFEGPPMLAF